MFFGGPPLERILLKDPSPPSVDVIYIASTKDETGLGASGQVRDLQGHHQDDQEQLLAHF